MFVQIENKSEQVTFQKGQSGNPGGRPKAFKSFKASALEHMDRQGVGTLISMASSEGEDRRFALKLLAEYAYGKPTQPVSGDSDAPPVQVSVTFDRADADAD